MAVVLVVEDEDQVRVLAESYLQEQGHKTFSASTVNEALAVMDEAEDIELLFTDIGLKGELEAGLDLAKQAVTLKPGLKVLYTTEQGITDGMTALFVENSAVLPKPYTVNQLPAILTVRFSINQNDGPAN